MNRKGIILSWAVPGQTGHSHVNERNNEYILERFEKLGYTHDNLMAQRGRERAEYDWFKNTFMVFVRNKGAVE